MNETENGDWGQRIGPEKLAGFKLTEDSNALRKPLSIYSQKVSKIQLSNFQ